MITEPEKVAVIDVGSNSVRLVVYYGAKRAPLQFFNEKVVCGLGRDLADSGKLHSGGRKRALNAIRRFVGIAQRMGVHEIHTVATAAVRNARDGADFCDEVLLETGLKLRVVTGAQEGALSAQGVFFCQPKANGLVCDMGGSSMELAQIGRGEVQVSKTSSLGPLQLQTFDGAKTRTAEIEKQLTELTKDVPPQETIYMIGGTIRAIAALDMARKTYPLNVLNEYALPAKDFEKLLRWILQAETGQIEAFDAVSSDRLDYLPIVAQVLLGLLDRVKPKQVRFSSFGIREGVLYENMPLRIQRRDPLIEACQFSEQENARFKEFGTTLYAWLLPLFGKTDGKRKRLIWAACLLHDVTWAAHPSYRAEASFDYATRANLAGLDHRERIFLAVALIHRYKNKPQIDKLDQLNVLLSEADQLQAEALGRAMRLGAMLGGPDVAHMGQLNMKAGQLTLVLDQQSAGLIGEVAERRLQSLAKTLGKSAAMQIV
jgi:exopolyphosphatase / guanosine-5'-triphosphate,3'-diphosphate pyrophosphatase